MDVVSVIYTRYEDQDGTVRYNVAACNKTDEEPPTSLVMKFKEPIKVIDTGLAFTKESNVFIENRLVQTHNLMNGHIVSGVAVRSFNKKRTAGAGKQPKYWPLTTLIIKSYNSLDTSNVRQ